VTSLSHEEYVLRYGPTAGDLVRLGDTDLHVRIEADHVGALGGQSPGGGQPDQRGVF
jgi:urease subunit alpha